MSCIVTFACVTICDMKTEAEDSRIRVARGAAGLTQKELADKLGTSQQNVDRWEKGVAPNKKWRGKLKEVLGMDAMDIESMSQSLHEEMHRPLKPLPLLSLDEYVFQDFVVELLRCQGHKNAIVYGKRGDAQDGIDVLSMDSDKIVVQCKRVQKFKESDAKEVVDTYEKGGREDKEKILAITIMPGVRVIDTMKKAGWAIWNPETITGMVRGLPENKQRRLIRAFFDDDALVLENCLGLQPDSALIEVKRYFKNREAGLIPYNDKYCDYAGDPLEDMVNLINSDAPAVIVLSGAGGTGKTRRLKEIALKTSKEILLIKNGFIPDNSEISRVLRDGSVIAIDDAHRKDSALEICLTGYMNQEASNKKLIILTREYAKEKVMNLVREAGVSVEIVKEFNVGILEYDDAFKLAESVIGNNSPYLEQLVKVSGGNALLITMGTKLLRKNGTLPAKLLNDSDGKDFIKHIFEVYVAEAFDADNKRSLGEDILSLLAVVQPCTSVQLFDLSRDLFGGKFSNIEIRRTINVLEECGLISGGNKVQVVPDLLADYECERMLLGKSGSDQGILDEILGVVLGGPEELFVNIFQNVCQLDWRTEMVAGANTLKQRLWGDFKRRMISANTGERIKLLETLRGVAYYSPEEALATVDLAMKSPAGEESRRYDGAAITNDDVLKKLPGVLLVISYHERFLEMILDRLVELATRYPDWGRSNRSPIEIMKEIARFELYKPVVYTEKVSDYILKNGFREGFPFPPYEILGECLKTGGHSALSRGKISIEYRQFVVRVEKVRDFRRKIVDKIIDDINGGSIDCAVRAASLLHLALNMSDGRGWETERDWILEQIQSKINYAELRSVVAAVMMAELSPMLRGEGRDIISKIIEKIPKNLENELARSLVDAWGHETFIDDDYEKAHLEYIKWLGELAAKLVKKYDCSDILKFIRQDLADMKYWRETSDEGYANAIIFYTLCGESEKFCDGFAEAVLGKGDFRSLFGVSLTNLVRKYNKTGQAVDLVNKVLKNGDSVLLQAVARFVVLEIDMLPLEWVADTLKELLESDDYLVKRAVIEDLRFLPKTHRNLAIDLVNALDFDPENQEVLSAVLEIVNPRHGVVLIDSLSEKTKKEITEALVCRPNLEYLEVDFLQSVVEERPIDVVDLMIKRLRKNDDGSNWWERNYSPVPFAGNLKVGIDIAKVILDRIWKECETGTELFHFYGSRLIQFFGISREDLLNFIVKILPITKREETMKIFIRALPLEVLWDYDSVQKLVQTEQKVADSGMIINMLFGLIFDDKGGMHGRTIGEPGPFESELRDRSIKMLEKCRGNWLLNDLYERINKYAVNELVRQEKSDKELLKV